LRRGALFFPSCFEVEEGSIILSFLFGGLGGEHYCFIFVWRLRREALFFPSCLEVGEGTLFYPSCLEVEEGSIILSFLFGG